MKTAHPPRTFLRLANLQLRAWQHGHRAWATALGQRLREMRMDFPDLRAWD